MSFCLTRDQISKLMSSNSMPEFTGAEMLTAIFETSPEVAREVLPKPLSPTSDCTAVAFVARYPQTNFGCVYNEGALSLFCEYKGERGLYCLSMPVDDDMAMIGGREQFGFPKKIADKITLGQDGASVIGSVIRKGVEILRIECELTGDAPDDLMDSIMPRTKDWDGVDCNLGVGFLFKYFPSPSGTSFDYLPRLVRAPVLFRTVGTPKVGEGQVKLASTPSDPLGEIPVRKVAQIAYGTYNNTMLPGKVVGRVWNPFRFIKHAFFKTDFLHVVLENHDPSETARTKEIKRKARRY